jgi:hypothetical protein
MYTGRQLPSYFNVDKHRLLQDVGRDVLYNRYLRNPVSDANDQISIPDQRTIQCVSTPLNYGRPLTAHVNALPLTDLEAARSVLTQPHADNTFYDQITPDSRLGPRKGDDACEPLHSRNSDAIIAQPSTSLNVSAAHRPNSQITADTLAKSQRQLAKDGNARLERIITTDPPRSSGSHATIDPAICQRNDHSRPDSTSLPVTRPDSHAAMHINEASASCTTFIPRETDFMLTDYAHLCKTSCARQCRPRATVPGPSQSITPLGANTRLEPYNATEHVNERTFETPHRTASDLTNDGTTDYKSSHTDGYPLSATTHDQFSVAAEATATPIRSDQDIKSAIAEQSGADDSSAHTPTECHASAADMTSYKALSLAP